MVCEEKEEEEVEEEGMLSEKKEEREVEGEGILTRKPAIVIVNDSKVPGQVRGIHVQYIMICVQVHMYIVRINNRL